MYSVRVTDIDNIISTKKPYGNLYLGNIRAAEDAQLMKNHNIRAILSVIDINVNISDYGIKRKQINLEDEEDQDISEHFEDAYNFIDEQLKSTNVFVHCYAGISRSATIVIAYLMKKTKQGLRECQKTVQLFRSQIDPNPGFMKQLRQYEQLLNRQASQQILDNLSFEPKEATKKNTSGILLSSYFSPKKSSMPDVFQSAMKPSQKTNTTLASNITQQESSRYFILKTDTQYTASPVGNFDFDLDCSLRQRKLNHLKNQISKLGEQNMNILSKNRRSIGGTSSFIKW